VAQVQSEETSERLKLLVDELGLLQFRAFYYWLYCCKNANADAALRRRAGDESVTLECIDTSDVFAGATVQVRSRMLTYADTLTYADVC
jgi:hypothetical protein